jgi:uncharacterized protein YxeA
MDIDKEWDEIFLAGNGNGEAKSNKNNNVREKEVSKKKIIIKKYTAKGSKPLHECIVIGQEPKFVYLDKNNKPQFVDSIERVNDTLIPADTFDTQNPIPFIFDSKEHFERWLEESERLCKKFIFIKSDSIKFTRDEYDKLKTAFCEGKGWSLDYPHTVNVRSITLTGNYKWMPESDVEFRIEIEGQEEDPTTEASNYDTKIDIEKVKLKA